MTALNTDCNEILSQRRRALPKIDPANPVNDVSYYYNHLSVTTSGDNRVYANGRMQLELIVAYEAINTATGQAMTAPQKDIDSITLVNFRTGEPLPGGWYVSSTPNEFRHVIGRPARTMPLPDQKPRNLPGPRAARAYPTTKRYLATDVVAAMQVAVTITAGDGTVYTTAFGDINTPGQQTESYVQIDVLAPLRHQASQLNLQVTAVSSSLEDVDVYYWSLSDQNNKFVSITANTGYVWPGITCYKSGSHTTLQGRLFTDENEVFPFYERDPRSDAIVAAREVWEHSTTCTVNYSPANVATLDAYGNESSYVIRAASSGNTLAIFDHGD